MNTGIRALVSLLGASSDDPVLLEVIVQLGNGAPPDMREPVAWWTFPERGIDIMLAVNHDGELRHTGTVAAIHAFAEGYEGHRQYSGELIGNISFFEQRMVIQEKLGAPLESGGGGYSSVLNKRVPNWDRYAFTDCTLQLQYDSKGRLSLVTVMPPSETSSIR